MLLAICAAPALRYNNVNVDQDGRYALLKE